MTATSARMDTLPRIAALTMAHREETMLPLWIAHYRRLVGRENLFVLDHDSAPPIVIEGVRVERLTRETLDEDERLAIMATWQKRLLRAYDWVVTVDTDEFVTHRPDRWRSLPDLLANGAQDTRRCVGCEVIDPGGGPLDWAAPILRQRPSGMISSWSCKPCVSRVPTMWTPGFHTATSPAAFDPDLWLLHLKYADEAHLLDRLALTRDLPWSESARRQGHGQSHRMPDAIMRRHMATLRGQRLPPEHAVDLDACLGPGFDPDQASTPVMAIPEALLDVF